MDFWCLKPYYLVVSKNPSDFVGAVLGASESNTKAILANSIGKVLIIDEVSMRELFNGGKIQQLYRLICCTAVGPMMGNKEVVQAQINSKPQSSTLSSRRSRTCQEKIVVSCYWATKTKWLKCSR